MRKLTSVLIVVCVVAGTAFVSTAPQRHWKEKLDAPLVQAATAQSADPVNALIRLRPGTANEFAAHLSKSHGMPATMVSADIVSVRLPASMLRSIALDHDVVHVSVP